MQLQTGFDPAVQVLRQAQSLLSQHRCCVELVANVSTILIRLFAVKSIYVYDMLSTYGVVVVPY